MKNFLFITVILTIFFACKTKQVYNRIKIDEKTNNKMLYGYTNLDGFKKEPFKTWYETEYNAYQPDMQTIEKLGKEQLNEIEISIVMGSWCSDSQREIPRFIKIMESIGYHTGNLKIICVDRKKQAEKTPVAKLNIELVPTIIFTKDKKEVGRIVETPKESLEKDLVKIIGD